MTAAQLQPYVNQYRGKPETERRAMLQHIRTRAETSLRPDEHALANALLPLIEQAEREIQAEREAWVAEQTNAITARVLKQVKQAAPVVDTAPELYGRQWPVQIWRVVPFVKLGGILGGVWLLVSGIGLGGLIGGTALLFVLSGLFPDGKKKAATERSQTSPDPGFKDPSGDGDGQTIVNNIYVNNTGNGTVNININQNQTQ